MGDERICNVDGAFWHEARAHDRQKPVTFFLALAKLRNKITCVFRMAAEPWLARNIWRSGLDGSRSYE
jgi:hypothetical protein